MKRQCLGTPGRRCPALISGASRCPTCQRGIYQHRNAHRDQFARRLYGSAAWKALARAILEAAGYRCHYCGGPANSVDHVVRVVDDYSRALDPTNLVACCRSDQEKRKHAAPGGAGVGRKTYA